MSDKRERELAEELEFHRALKERKYRELGLSPQQAADQAKRDFGGYEKFKELCREVGRWRWFDDLSRDLTLAFRTLRKSPVFTAVALITLTLGIGANTAIFSLMNGLMLKLLPVPSPSRLVMLSVQPTDVFGQTMSYALFQETEKQTADILQTFAFEEDSLKLRTPEGAQPISAELVSGQYFSALGVQPQMGRWITRNDGPVAVITNHFWRTHLNADPNPLGRAIVFGQTALTVIGVMPETFRGMHRDYRPEVFIPLQLQPILDAPDNDLADPAAMWFIQAGARLKDGVSRQQANALLAAKSGRFWKAATGQDHFALPDHTTRDLSVVALPAATGYSFLRLRFQDTLLVLMALVALVLLVACLNIAILLLARGAGRAREISTRLALGASRGRLIRQLLTESLLLAVAGTVLGFLLSPALAALVRTGLDYEGDFEPDLTVFLFTAAIAIFATVLTGTLPALQSTRMGVSKRPVWPRVMLSLEVALALVLVTGATLLGFSLFQEHRIAPGFQARGLIYLYPNAQDFSRVPYHDVVSELLKLPTVAHASFAQSVPFGVSYQRGDVGVPGGPTFRLWRNNVGPDYFATMGIRLLEGREFVWPELSPAARSVILSESAARELFPGGHALGKEVSVFQNPAKSVVIGVAADVRHLRLRTAAAPTIYTPDGTSFAFLVRTSGNAAPLMNAAKETLKRAIPHASEPSAFSMERQLASDVSTERTMTLLASLFGALALLMTGIGLYGSLAYATERRTSEIGIRVALGALPRNIIALICAENGAITLIGCAAGLSISASASKAITSFLYEVSPRDPLVFAAASLLLLTVAAAASLLPARKAAKADPISAIRYE